MTSSAFDDETAVVAAGSGRYRSHVSPAWCIGAVPNGGYSLATTLAAMTDVAGQPDPLSVTCHFLRPVTADATADIAVDLVRAGRTVSTVSATLAQDGRTRLFAVAALGALDSDSDSDSDGDDVGGGGFVEIERPDLPGPDDCLLRSGASQQVELALASRVETRLHPRFDTPDPDGPAEVSGWIRLADGRPPDTRALVLFADAFPPSPAARVGATGWVPTIELTVHVRRRPAPGWVCGRFVTHDIQDGRMIEDGCLWDSTGALVARSRQLGLYR